MVWWVGLDRVGLGWDARENAWVGGWVEVCREVGGQVSGVFRVQSDGREEGGEVICEMTLCSGVNCLDKNTVNRRLWT